MITFICWWLAIGYVMSWIAISVFRSVGSTTKDLYLATIGPLFGPILFIMFFIDYVRWQKAKKTKKIIGNDKEGHLDIR